MVHKGRTLVDTVVQRGGRAGEDKRLINKSHSLLREDLHPYQKERHDAKATIPLLVYSHSVTKKTQTMYEDVCTRSIQKLSDLGFYGNSFSVFPSYGLAYALCHLGYT
jgi:hypothetical protein